MPIELKNATRIYTANAEVRALDDASLSVAPGEWLAVMGPSGSRKSTLVNLIGCLDQPTSGEVWINGMNVAQMSAVELNHFRAEKIGFIFQQFHLIPYLTALENVMLAQYFHSMTDQSEARAALERIGLADRADHLPAQLSGGEQQRVCIARIPGSFWPTNPRETWTRSMKKLSYGNYGNSMIRDGPSLWSRMIR